MCTSMWPTQLCLGINSLESWKRSLLKKIIFYFPFWWFMSYDYYYNMALLLYRNDWSGKGWGGRRPRVLSQSNYSGAGCHISHMDILPFIFNSEIPFNHDLTFSMTSGVPFLCQKSKGRGQLNVHKRKITVPSTWTVINVILVTENLVIHIIFTSCFITWRHQEITN